MGKEPDGSIRSLIPAGVVALLLAVALLILRLGAGGDPLRRTVDLPVLLQQIQQMNELVTVKYGVQKVIGLEEQKFPVGNEKILLTVQASVLAGIDMSKIQADKVRILDQERVYIELPPPRILEVVLDEKQTRVWDRRVTWWTPWVPYNNDLERRARLEAIQTIEQSAREMGILEQARKNAEMSLRGLLTPLGFKTIAFGPLS